MSIEYANNVDNMYVKYIRPVEQQLKRERDRRERDRTVVGFTTTYAVSAYYVIKFVSDLRKVGDFLRVLWLLRFPPPIKLTSTK